MKRFSSSILAGLAVVLLAAMVSVPAAGAWKYTSANPCTFLFTDNGGGDFTNPGNTTEVGLQSYSTANSLADGTVMAIQKSGGAVGFEWHHIFNSTAGSLALQSKALANTDVMWTACKVVNASGVTNFASDANVTTIAFVNGLVLETEATSVGDLRSTQWPLTYNWGGNYGRGGMGFSFRGAAYRPLEGEVGIMLTWQTKDPTTQADDCLVVYSPNSSTTDLISVAYPLGGDKDNPPRHVYKMSAKRSPLPWSPSANVALVNVWVDGNRVIKNRTINSGRQGSMDQGFFILGNGGQNSELAKLKGQRGDIYDYFTIYEADVCTDVTPPDGPTNVTATSPIYNCVMLSWTASTDDELIGYRIARQAPGGAAGFIAYQDTSIATTYKDSTTVASTTYTYFIEAVDACGNLMDSASVTVATPADATPPPFAGTTVTFDLNNPNATYTATSSPNYYSSDATETTMYWIGQKTVPGQCPVPGDGGFMWGGSPCNYQQKFENGSLTIQTVNGDQPWGYRSGVDSNDMGYWWKNIRHPNYDPDGGGPELPYTYVRGMKFTFDVNIVGDALGWCAQWPQAGPAIPPLTDPWGYYPCVAGGPPPIPQCTCIADPPYAGQSKDLYHWGSDWGGMGGGTNRGPFGFYMMGNKQLDAPGHEGFGATGSGEQFFVSIYTPSPSDPGDDQVRLWDANNSMEGMLSFKDPKGFGLVTENGTAPPTGNGSPRNGIVEGTTNHLIVEFATSKAPLDATHTNENTMYIDIWITRPDGAKIHCNPSTMNLLPCGGNCNWIFGTEGHTWYGGYKEKEAGNKIRLGNFDDSATNVWGFKFNKATIINDWNGEVIFHAKTIGELREYAKTSVGAIVTFDCVTGGEKVVSHQELLTVDGSAPFFIYVEQEDRSAGIRIIVADDAEATRGDKVSVKGLLLKDADGNLYVETRTAESPGAYCDLTPGGQVVAPLSLTNKAAGGKEVTGGAGAANVGLLATVWGKVSNKAVDGNGNITFDLDDGSATPVSVVDYQTDGLISPVPVNGEYWKATGILALKLVDPVPDPDVTKRLLIVDGDGTTDGFKTEKIPTP